MVEDKGFLGWEAATKDMKEEGEKTRQKIQCQHPGGRIANTHGRN